MNKIKLGIIGLGAIGNRMLKPIKEQYADQLEVVAVCDANETLAKEIAEEFSIPHYFKSHQELLKNAELDIVYIAVPPKYHEQVALDTIEAGVHILCEKPLANSIEEANSMLQAVENTSLIHMMNFPLNYQAQMYKMMSLIQSGYIGSIRRIDLNLHFPEWPRFWQKNSWVGKREQGGYILEVGAHWIQFIQKNFGQINFIQGEVSYPEDETLCENGVNAKLVLDNGINVYLDGISQVPGPERVELVVHGTEGSLFLENWGNLKGGKVGQPYESISTEGIHVGTLFDHLIESLRGNTANLYDFTVGYNVQVVLEAFKNPELPNGIYLVNLYK
ncbi:Gfo/Idh/MocA family protein [Bacillus pinisoli]|uniref:Gfo/Idh/MocA family protein n=1 Tax=Bacillus pinisoli TaxID=2901866 RepID=UPI001FF2314D|nr:Gfo/Idh/MocA family oxidoreductase [Bacillus pinisoli]